MDDGTSLMAMAGVGFFGMLIIGFLAGWIAEKTMNRDHGILTNILVGVAGSFVGGTAAGLLGFHWHGFVGNLVVATLGAIGILWFFGKREAPPRRQSPLERAPADPNDHPAEAGRNSEPRTPPIYHTKDD